MVRDFSLEETQRKEEKKQELQPSTPDFRLPFSHLPFSHLTSLLLLLLTYLPHQPQPQPYTNSTPSKNIALFPSHPSLSLSLSRPSKPRPNRSLISVQNQTKPSFPSKPDQNLTSVQNHPKPSPTNPPHRTLPPHTTASRLLRRV